MDVISTLTTVTLLENWQQEFRVFISFKTSDARTVVCVGYSFGIVLRENLIFIKTEFNFYVSTQITYISDDQQNIKVVQSFSFFLSSLASSFFLFRSSVSMIADFSFSSSLLFRIHE